MTEGEKRRKKKKKLADKEMKKFLLEDFRKNGCLICGSKEELEIHHLFSFEKLFHVGAAAHRSPTAIRKELEKCVCLCSHHHGLEHGEFTRITNKHKKEE